MSSQSNLIPATPDWPQELRDCGAVLEADGVLHFGEPESERAALLTAPTLHPLVDWSLLRASGPDAGSFLQGQFSNDIDVLDPSRAQLSTYCTAQGRMLASLVLWREASGYIMQLPAEIAQGVRTRLQKHVLRAKVTLCDVTAQMRAFGLGGPGASAALEALVDKPPAAPWGIACGPHVKVISLHDQLFVVIVSSEHWRAAWDHLCRLARPAGSAGWRWHLIAAGIPVITAATQEQFVPQMANFEQLGAISFTKGCYPGQEIVARARYRGEVKRRLYRLHGPAGAPAAGQAIFQPGESAACGMVLNAAPAPGGGFDLLAVLLTSAAETGTLCLASRDGPPLHLCR
jgi:folate-binding protein YgfZ